MGRWRTSYVSTTPKKTFKMYYIAGAIFGIFAVASGGLALFDDKELTKAKWKGLLLGALIQSVVLFLVYAFCHWAEALPVGITLFVGHIIHIIAFGVLYGRNDNAEKENVFNSIFNQPLEEYMKTFREIAEDMGKIDNYHKHYDSLKEKTRLLQSQYGYALQDLPNRPVITTSLCLYYILDADGYIYIHTKQPTTEEQFIDIVQAIIDNCNDDLLNENPDMFIMGIVANYFSPLLITNEDE